MPLTSYAALLHSKCGVAPSGVCTDMGPLAASATLDSTLTSFPSANFTYCEAADAVCRDCKTAWTREYKNTGVYPLGKICQGERGCVCLSQCESPSFSARVITSECSLFAETAGVTKQIYTAMCVLGLVVIAYSIYRAWQREKIDEGALAMPRIVVARDRLIPVNRVFCCGVDLERERRERQEQRRLRRAAQRGVKGTGCLSLTGWKALQERLLETERAARGTRGARAARERGDELPVDRNPGESPAEAVAPQSAPGTPAAVEDVVAIRIT